MSKRHAFIGRLPRRCALLTAITLAATGVVGNATPAYASTTSSYAYVVGNGLAPINLATNAVGTSIGVGPDLFYIAITPNGKSVYLVNDLSYGAATPVNTVTDAVGSSIKRRIAQRRDNGM